MENMRNKFGLGKAFLLGALILLMITVFGTRIFAQGSVAATAQEGAKTNVIVLLDPFLLEKVAFAPKPVLIPTARITRGPRFSVNNGNSNGNPPVIIPGRRAVRSQWCPGGPPILPPGLQ